MRFLNAIEAEVRAARWSMSSTTTPPSIPERFVFIHANLVMRSRASSPGCPGAAETRRLPLVVDLQAAVNQFLAEAERRTEALHMDRRPRHNNAAVRRGHQAFNSIH